MYVNKIWSEEELNAKKIELEKNNYKTNNIFIYVFK